MLLWKNIDILQPRNFNIVVHRSLTTPDYLMIKITFLIVAFIIEDQPEEFQNGRNSKMANGRNSKMVNEKNSNMPQRQDSGEMEEIKLNSYDLDVHMMYKCNTTKSYNGGSEPSAPAELR